MLSALILPQISSFLGIFSLRAAVVNIHSALPHRPSPFSAHVFLRDKVPFPLHGRLLFSRSLGRDPSPARTFLLIPSRHLLEEALLPLAEVLYLEICRSAFIRRPPHAPIQPFLSPPLGRESPCPPSLIPKLKSFLDSRVASPHRMFPRCFPPSQGKDRGLSPFFLTAAWCFPFFSAPPTLEPVTSKPLRKVSFFLELFPPPTVVFSEGPSATCLLA